MTFLKVPDMGDLKAAMRRRGAYGYRVVPCLIAALGAFAFCASWLFLRNASGYKFPSLAAFRLYLRGRGPSKDSGIVWVVSHRRSGTHMTMDIMANAIQGPLTIVKTAHVVPLKGRMTCECLTYIRSKGEIVHAYRDVRDVVIANYYYRRVFDKRFQEMTIQEYLSKPEHLEGVIDSWASAVFGWFSIPNVLPLNFDDSASSLGFVYKRLSDFLSRPIKNIDLDTGRMKSPSHAVGRGVGNGPSGWHDYMDSSMSSRILARARKTGKRVLREVLRCPVQKRWNMTGSIDVRDSGIRVPASCGPDFARTMVIRVAK